jgi:hypothetical protein
LSEAIQKTPSIAAAVSRAVISAAGYDKYLHGPNITYRQERVQKATLKVPFILNSAFSHTAILQIGV